jgi:hypothetical protein
MGLKGYRLWVMGQLDSTCRALPRRLARELERAQRAEPDATRRRGAEVRVSVNNAVPAPAPRGAGGAWLLLVVVVVMGLGKGRAAPGGEVHGPQVVTLSGLAPRCSGTSYI